METCPSLPEGLFQKFIVKSFSMGSLKDFCPWNTGFIASVEEDTFEENNTSKQIGRLHCSHKRQANNSIISIVSCTDESNIYELWEYVSEIIQVTYTVFQNF